MNGRNSKCRSYKGGSAANNTAEPKVPTLEELMRKFNPYGAGGLLDDDDNVIW